MGGVGGEPAVRELAREEARLAWMRLRRSATSLVGLGIVVVVILAALLAPYLAPYPEDAGAGVHFDRAHRPPTADHWFGTDEVGRDIFTRVLFGARLSLALAVGVLAVAMAVGVVLGLVAGTLGGRAGTLIMRVTDVFLAVPPLVLALAAAAVFPPTPTTALFAIALSWWPWYARLAYGEVLRVREEAFVEASRSLGAGPLRTAFVEILPNVVAPLVVKATLDMGFVVLMEASLSFLGLGAQPPTPSWGVMVAEGRVYLPEVWWQSTFPGLAMLVTVMGFNLLGDGLRDVLDVQADPLGG